MSKTFIQEKPPYLRLSHVQHRITESFSATAQEIDFFFLSYFQGSARVQQRTGTEVTEECNGDLSYATT